MHTQEAMLKHDKKPPQTQRAPGRESDMIPEPIVIRESYRGSGKLENKIALITGGDSGIGRSVAVHFAREGADVAIVYLPEEEEDALITREMVGNEGRKCLLLSGDLKERKFCKAVVKETIKQFGKLNILVNNAGEQHPEEDFMDIDPDIMEETFRTNIFAMILTAQAAVPHMTDGDCIINCASVTAYRGSQSLVDYSSTKGAIVAFTRALSGQLAEKKIRVNGVAPGPIWTPLIPSTFKGEKVSKFGQDTPMGRAGQPCEVAPAFVFLACDDASYITGQFIHPNGGTVLNT
ncbi:MAG: SDR family oxidoreductase [Bacteroidota bacterium]